MAADLVHRDAGRELVRAVVKLHAACEHAMHHARDVVGLERVVDLVVAHAAARHVLHLGVLHVEARVREQRAVAAMVVVHVSDDDVFDVGVANADGLEPFFDGVHDLAIAFLRHRGVEARVDDDRAAAADDGPHVIVERHVPVLVRIAVDEIAPGLAADVRVLDREDLVGRCCHGSSRLTEGRRCGIVLVRCGEEVVSSRRSPRRPLVPLSPLLLACLAATWFIWGSTYLAIKFALVSFPPFYQMGTRFLVAGCC